jgi:hypothetical protein
LRIAHIQVAICRSRVVEQLVLLGLASMPICHAFKQDKELVAACSEKIEDDRCKALKLVGGIYYYARLVGLREMRQRPFSIISKRANTYSRDREYE